MKVLFVRMYVASAFQVPVEMTERAGFFGSRSVNCDGTVELCVQLLNGAPQGDHPHRSAPPTHTHTHTSVMVKSARRKTPEI